MFGANTSLVFVDGSKGCGPSVSFLGTKAVHCCFVCVQNVKKGPWSGVRGSVGVYYVCVSVVLLRVIFRKVDLYNTWNTSPMSFYPS